MTTCSPARLAANRSNASRSTGPRTAEGKARSRANAHKHGMTGEGVARPGSGAAEIEARLGEVAAPILARRVAVLADRLDRLARHDDCATAWRVRDAEAPDGGEARHRELDGLVASPADEPAATVRNLRRSAAGTDRLLALWDDLARDLEAGRPWTDDHRDRATRLAGRSPGGLGLSRVEALSAIEGEGRAAALAEVAAIIAAESAALRAHRASLPPVDAARERTEAAALALFDGSDQGALFRRYELATERNFYKALAEIKRAGALDLANAALEPRIAPEPPAFAPAPLGSFGAGPAAGPTPPETLAPIPGPGRPDPVPAPAPAPARKGPTTPALMPGAWIIPSTLPAAWEQNDAYGKNLRNFLDPADLAVPRPARRARLPRR